MGQISIEFSLIEKLDFLTKILYKKEYFGFMKSAENYIDKIYDFIYTIPLQPKRICKDSKYGKYFAVYKMNENTTYYITYDVYLDFYLVKNIFNNHEEAYPIYIQ